MKSGGARSFRHPGGLTGYPTSFNHNTTIPEVPQISERISLTAGGFASCGSDRCAWMREAGFRKTRVEHLAGQNSMVIGIK
jgi:hypothetical protein